MKKAIAFAVFFVMYLTLISVADIDNWGEGSLLILTVASAQVYTIIGREGKVNGGN